MFKDVHYTSQLTLQISVYSIIDLYFTFCNHRLKKQLYIAILSHSLLQFLYHISRNKLQKKTKGDIWHFCKLEMYSQERTT